MEIANLVITYYPSNPELLFPDSAIPTGNQLKIKHDLKLIIKDEKTANTFVDICTQMTGLTLTSCAYDKVAHSNLITFPVTFPTKTVSYWRTTFEISVYSSFFSSILILPFLRSSSFSSLWLLFSLLCLYTYKSNHSFFLSHGHVVIQFKLVLDKGTLTLTLTRDYPWWLFKIYLYHVDANKGYKVCEVEESSFQCNVQHYIHVSIDVKDFYPFVVLWNFYYSKPHIPCSYQHFYLTRSESVVRERV